MNNNIAWKILEIWQEEAIVTNRKYRHYILHSGQVETDSESLLAT